MSDFKLNIDIPLDQDGFIEMECDFCKERFMLHKDVYQDEKYLHFFCPICGLPNNINTFYCPEVLEKAGQIASNYMMTEVDKMLKNAFKGFRTSKKSGITISVDIPEQEKPREIYEHNNIYDIDDKKCCKVLVKISSFSKMIGTYCPICGVQKDE